ncbi:MAG TPA: dihydrofolate reductase family protein [Cyclobacteriaceae bacterium]|nr:dihydrofolate reductase family protein [Cyclobacteriaceae bacterium]
MGKLSVFNFMTLNGFYKGAREDISWHKNNAGQEEGDYAAQGAQSKSMLLFGRTTYEMMAGFWPTPAAMEYMPKVAEGMNKSEKIVFSTTLKKAGWNNTRIVRKNIGDEVVKLKKEGKIMTILGSGTIVSQLADANLIDEYQFMIDPVALRKGTPIFKGASTDIELALIDSRVFKSGAVLLCYKPVRK